MSTTKLNPEAPLIYGKIKAIIDDLGAIGKDRVNAEQKFKYRGIDQFYNQLHPLFAKHGVFSVPEILERVEQPHATRSGSSWRHVVIKMKYTFYAEDGSNFTSVVFGEGLDSGDKATNKAMAIAHKYCLLQVFCVATDDMEDPDEHTAPERGEKVQVRPQPQSQTAPAPQPPPAPQPSSNNRDKVEFLKKCDSAYKWLEKHKVPADVYGSVLGALGFEKPEQINDPATMTKVTEEYGRIMREIMMAGTNKLPKEAA
jgi:hypothetical protein